MACTTWGVGAAKCITHVLASWKEPGAIVKKCQEVDATSSFIEWFRVSSVQIWLLWLRHILQLFNGICQFGLSLRFWFWISMIASKINTAILLIANICCLYCWLLLGETISSKFTTSLMRSSRFKSKPSGPEKMLATSDSRFQLREDIRVALPATWCSRPNEATLFKPKWDILVRFSWLQVFCPRGLCLNVASTYATSWFLLEIVSRI